VTHYMTSTGDQVLIFLCCNM